MAKKYAAVYLRMDAIEMAIRSSNVLRDDVGPAGYVSAYWVAEENLRLGQPVVADSVNALQVTRDSWARVPITLAAFFELAEQPCGRCRSEKLAHDRSGICCTGVHGYSQPLQN